MRRLAALGKSPSARPWPGWGCAAAALLCALTLLARPGRALAFHDDEQRVIIDTAYTLREDEWRLGLWRVDYGFWDDFYVGTHTVPWIVAMANLHAKYRFLSDDRIDLAAGVGLYWLDLKRTRYLADALKKTDSDARFVILPAEIAGTYRFDEGLSLTVAPVFTAVALTGTYNADEFEGAGAVTNLQLTATLEQRVSRVVALLAHARFLAYQYVKAAGELQLDDYTTAELHAGADIDVQNAWSITLCSVFSWQTFNLRVGIGYGHYNIPAVNFVIPIRIPYPELDLYWRF
jgi:hypothetical protein